MKVIVPDMAHIVTEEIYIVHVSSHKQDFNKLLKLHNYFNNFLEF